MTLVRRMMNGKTKCNVFDNEEWNRAVRERPGEKKVARER